MTEQHQSQPHGDEVAETTPQRAESFTQSTAKFAADAAYALAGVAGMLGDKAREFYDEQRAEYAKTHPDVDSPGAKEFLSQLGTHLDKFVEELSKGFQELSARGREVVARSTQDQAPAAPEETVTAPDESESPSDS